jgi:hypothetical protein
MSTSPRILTGILILSAVPGWAAELTREQSDFFESKIRPILAEQCYKCHSIERGKSKGNLTLDTKAGLEKGGETGPAVVPGDPQKSLLYTALTYTDKDLQMPPTSSGGKLGDAQIADIAAWIKMGAPDPRLEGKKGKLSGLTDSARAHWAYREPARYTIPVNKNQQWCRTPIDCYILEKLEANGLLPSPDTERETLLRRVSYNLTGLPPTYAEVESFMNDASPNAYEKVVDRLLASPAYGERWARHWLDTARYADTVGGPRNARNRQYRYPDAWTYRDYVVRSFNEDKPYTDFIIEQLAADKIPGIDPNDSRLAALGFLTVGERFQNANDIINDRIDVVSKGFLGLTVACARCHDHMFDPIPTKDYYALHGVFSSITEPEEKPLIGMKATPQQRQDFAKKYAVLVKQLGNQYYDIVGSQLNEFHRDSGAYVRAALASGGNRGKGGSDRQKELIDNYKLDRELVQFLGRGIQQNPSVWGPLTSYKNGGSKFRTMTAAEAGMMAQMLAAKVGEKGGDPSGKMAKTMTERLQAGPNPLVVKALTEKQPKSFDEAIEVYVQLFASLSAKAKGFIPAMKNATSQNVPGYDSATINLLRGPFEVVPAPSITQDLIESSIQGLPQRLAGRGRLNLSDINLLEISHPGAPARAMIVADKKSPVNSPVFIRGQSQTRGDIVPRGFLEILSPEHKPVAFTDGSGRMELAKCIASRDNPLTARVMVNRVWMHHFGEGFVRTPDDLGTMSEKPTHPELFDYLANWFMDNGWSLKKLHKLIVMSRVYQESSHTRLEYEATDPENRLYWRANVRRLDFEATRDSLLVYSGDLDRSVGGKPINLTDEPYSYRRSVYGYIDRGNLPELMAHFDFSDPDMPNSKRSTTIVPQQALFLMNSPMAVDVTRKILARSEITRQAGDLFRVAALYKVIFQRSPTPRETQMALRFLQTEAQSQSEAAAEIGTKTASTGKGRGDGMRRGDSRFSAIQNEGFKVTRKVLTPWETYVQALLFSNEAAYIN